MEPRAIGERLFVDGITRTVYEDDKGQYVIGDDGERVSGVFIIPEDDPDLPLIVEGR